MTFKVELWVEVRCGRYKFPGREFAADWYFYAFYDIQLPFPPFAGLKLSGPNDFWCEVVSVTWNLEAGAFNCKCESIDYDRDEGFTFSRLEWKRESMSDAGWRVSNIVEAVKE